MANPAPSWGAALADDRYPTMAAAATTTTTFLISATNIADSLVRMRVKVKLAKSNNDALSLQRTIDSRSPNAAAGRGLDADSLLASAEPLPNDLRPIGDAD